MIQVICRFASISVVAVFLAVAVFAQQDQFPQQDLTDPQQQQPKSQTDLPAYCAQPGSDALPECATSAPRADGFEMPGSTQSLPQNSPKTLPVVPGRIPTTLPSGMESIPKEQNPVISSARGEKVHELPTEFQKFVESSTGQALPIYGSWLFDRVPTTFAPVDRVPVGPDYTMGPGDEIDVRVWGQINFNQHLTVDRAGEVFLPQVGRVSIAGRQFGQVQDALKTAIGRVYKNFDLSVNVGHLRSIEVFVVGQARRPGTYTISSLSTLVNALFASGGPSSRGSMRDIQLNRGGKTITSFDLYDLLLRGDKSKDVSLRPGDVIFIPNAGPRVAIWGSVESPAIYEIQRSTCLREVLDDAGGLSSITAVKRAMLVRVDQHAALQSDNIQLNGEGLETALHDGDIIRLLPVVPRFEATVTLRGNVADPVRFPWHEGMKISEVIPNRESLLTRHYWHEHNRLQEDAGAPNFREVSLDRTADKSLASATQIDGASITREFLSKNTVEMAAPEIDWKYAVIERLRPEDLTTHLIPFNLGKVVIDHDASADLALQPGDIITIFSLADIATPRAQQTKYVRLEGEVSMAGIYSVHPGETLRSLIVRAGGLTPNAYLYGAQFTRESTRKEQQKRYSEFLDEMERQIEQSAAAVSTRAVSTEQAGSAQLAMANQRLMVQRLRETPVSGRVVLDIQPDSKRVEDLPEIPLEDGDRLLIPSVPSTVSVVGNVYNQAAFLYGSDLRAGDYLHDAGGATRYADSRHVFVIRADGSVIGKEGRSGLFVAKFDSLRMYPGDTLVVPANVTKGAAMRSFMDWTQAVSSFGVGAAAVNVLR